MSVEADCFCRVELFGALRLIHQGRVTDRFRRQKSALLLAYLALHPGRPHPRERLTDLLWPEMEGDAARDNLSATLSSLRRELEPPEVPAGTFLVADRQSVGLNGERIATDVAEFDHLLRSARSSPVVTDRARLLARAVALYQGDLLEGRYEEWVITVQSAYRERFREGLLNWAQDLEALQEWEIALAAAKRAVQTDPLREEAALVLMRVQARQGQVAGAMGTYRQFRERFLAEMGTEPPQELRRLVERLQRDPDALTAPRPAAVTTPAFAKPEGWEPERSEALFADPPNNLPQWLLPLIGRDQEAAEAARLLTQNRLSDADGHRGRRQNPAVAGNRAATASPPQGRRLVCGTGPPERPCPGRGCHRPCA